MSHRTKKRVDLIESESDEDMQEVMEEKYQIDDGLNGAEAGHVFDLKTKLALVNRIKEVNKRKTISFKVAVKHLDWTQVDVDGLSAEEAQDCLKQVLSPVNALRTLDEMLNDYLENYHKYELKKSINAPKLPPNAVIRYVMENRSDFEKKLKKKHPNEIIKLGDVSKYGAKRFQKLPEEEKLRYKEQYQQEIQEYHHLKKEFLILNPELKKPAKKRDQKNRPTKPKESKTKTEKEDTVVTPFKIFVKELRDKNPDIRYQEAQHQYKNLGDAEKLTYINKVIDLDTTLDKLFTAEEKKIMKHSGGMPVRPLSAYNAFVQAKIKNLELGKGNKAMAVISEMWKNVSDEEKKVFEDAYQEELVKWKGGMMKWISTLPPDQRAEQIAKHKLYSTSSKRKHDETVSATEQTIVKVESENTRNIIEIAQIDEARQKSPKKKKLASESDGASSSGPSKKKSKDQETIDWDNLMGTAKSSPTKDKDNVEKKLASLGPYPSQTTAHYFMVNRCEGKAMKKVAKAYKELTKADKKKLFQEMNKAKQAYVSKLKALAQNIDSKHNSRVMEFHKTNKEQQQKSISWHAASNTDIESNSESESDDEDSDDS